MLKLILLLSALITLNGDTGSRWIQFDVIGYASYHKLDLSFGIDTTSKRYTVKGVATVDSSADRWPNSDYYYLSNLFDGSCYFRAGGDTHHHSYWLGSCSSTQTETITIKFDEPQNISHIVVSARTIITDRWSWYAIDGYENATNSNYNAVEAVHITQMVNTDDDAFGQEHVHSVKDVMDALVLYIMKRGSYCALNEIEIFIASPPSPTLNPSTGPTTDPTKSPTNPPTETPSIGPTTTPTIYPTKIATTDPMKTPTNVPTTDRTKTPTNEQTTDPTKLPTIDPTRTPTPDPTRNPANHPTSTPTKDPTNDITMRSTMATNSINRTDASIHSSTQTPTENTSILITSVTATVPSKQSSKSIFNKSWKFMGDYQIQLWEILIFCLSVLVLCCCMIICTCTMWYIYKHKRNDNNYEAQPKIQAMSSNSRYMDNDLIGLTVPMEMKDESDEGDNAITNATTSINATTKDIELMSLNDESD